MGGGGGGGGLHETYKCEMSVRVMRESLGEPIPCITSKPNSYIPGILHIHISPEVRFIVARHLRAWTAKKKQLESAESANNTNLHNVNITLIV